MKKILLFVLTLLMGLGSLQLSAQQLVEIGVGGTTTNSYLPLYSFYNNTLSEQIYTAAEIGTPGTITSIAFYNAGSTKSPDLKIYMINTNKTEFSSTTDWMTVTANDLVYDGTSVALTAGTWTTIQLDNPFVYDGASNLGLIVDAHLSYSSGLSCYVFSGTSNCAMYVYSDGTDYSAIGASYTANSRLSVKNQIKLEIIAGTITCHHVGTVTASGVTANDATITWNTPEDAGSYILQYKESSEDWNSSNVETVYPNDTTYDLSGVLSPMTHYDVRVANMCSNGDTSMWRSTSFTTACAAIPTLPYTDGFDTYGTGTTAYPSCWSKINTYTSGDRPYVNSTHYSGVGSLYFYAGTSGTYNIAITPMFDQSIPINTLQADFMYRATYSSDRLIVGVMDDYTDASTFVPVDTVYPGSTVTAWEERSVSFANYTGTGQFIAFKNEYTTTSTYGYMDDLYIDLIPSCPKPQYLTLSNYTTEGCDASWTPSGTESIWEVVVVPAGADVNTGTPETVYSYPYTITDLSDDTQYDVYVRANCGGDVSPWSVKATFTTNPLCTSARNLTVSQVTGTSALLSWQSAEYGATGYTVAYSEAGMENWNTEMVTGTQYMLSGLDPATEYDVYVLTNCDEGQANPVTASFITNCLAGGDPFTEGTITTYNVPLNNYYNYTYTQQIYLASEMGGAATLDSIAFYYNYSSPSTVKTNVTIYLGHTSQSTFSSTSNYIPSTNLTQVYTGSLNCTQGWNTFVFTTPFQYNGSDNLVLVVDDNSGDYDGSSYVFLAHNAGADRSLYFYSDSYNPAPSNPTSAGASSSTSSTRSNVKFFIPCDNTITCVSPNMYVSEVSANSISIAWVPGNTESSWELEYSEDGTIWNSEGIVSTSPYTIDNLNANTVYNIRLRAVCGGGEYSNWSTASARTACSDVTIPYTENFDSAPGSGSGNMVTCWTTGSNYTSTHYPYTSSSYHYSGGYSAYFYGTSAYYSYLASPEFDENVDMSNLQVRFYAYKTSASYYIQVGVMTDPNDPSTFVQVGQNLTPSATSTWEYIDVNTDSYTGTGRYIAFRIPAVSASYMYIDDIEVDVIPVCLHVDNIQTSNITTTTADLSWTVGGDETEWEVVYGLAGTITDPDNETPITVSGAPETTFSGLYPSMGYDVYVRAVCSGSESSIWWHATFNTACGEIAVLPFMENFDNMGTGSTVFPNCWYRYNNYSTSTSYPYVSNSYHSSGNASLYFYCSTSTYNIAVLPAIDVNTYPINTLQVSFQMRSTSSTTSGIQVGVMVDSANVSSFEPLQTVHNSTTGTFQSFEVPLTNYTGTGNRIALKLVNTSSTYSIYLDDLVVEVAPLCDKPTSVTASNLTATTADINWMLGGNETSWEMVVVPAGVPVTAGTPETVTTHPYTLTELDDNTAYDVYVRADCGTGTDFSSWSQVCHFSTTPLCSAPTNVTVSQITGTSALLTWTPAVFGANGYTIAYTETGMESWTTQTVTGDNYMLSGLTPETAYTLTITSECDEGTAPVVTRNFTTSCLYGGDNIVGNGTSTSYNIPLNTFYNYSYVQQLYLASEINNSGDINSIGFQYIYTTAQTKNNQSIYLAETDLTSLSTWIPADSLTLVYSGSISFNNSGPDNWVTIPLTTPFNYSGTRNLVVVVKNDHGDYTTSSNNTFKTHSASGMTVQYYDDSSPFSMTSPSSASTYSYRNNIKFGMECDNTVTCIAPNVYVSGVTETSITINWAPGNGESSWEVETSTDGTTWNPEGTASSTPYTLSNLNPNTLYSIRLRSICGGGEFSTWAVVSQRTECAPIATVPYMENFDTYTGSTNTSMATNNLPNCWSYINEGTSTSYSGYPIIYSSSSYAASGSNSMRFYTYTTSGTYDDQIAVLPIIDVTTLPINTLQLTFDARALSTSYPFNLEIGVLTDPTDANTFTLVSTVSTQSTAYANYEVSLGAYTGTGAYVAIKAPQPTSNYNYGYVDNVVLENIPTCPKPTQVHVMNTTDNSIEVGWTENGSATAWVIEYGPAGFTPGTGTEENASTNPYTINNLTASTQYDIYVKSDCNGGDFSNYSSVLTAATECAAVDQLPYTENFDTYSTGESAYPLCWGKINTYSSNRPYVNSTHYEGVGSLYFYASSTTYNIAVMPQFDATIPVNTLQASFMYRAYNSTDYTIVGVMTNANDATTFVPVDTIYPGSPVSTWVEKEVVFSNYTGTGQYIAFYNGNPSATCYTYIDNLVVDLIPSCPKPHNLTINDATTTSIELSWTEVGSATSWEIAYGTLGFDPNDATEATYVTANTNPFTVQNLNNSSTYDFYVRALCSSSDVSYWTNKLTASTTMLPIDLPYTATFDANDAWVLNNGSCTNYWTMGTVNGDAALFVTDNGTTPNYTITSTSVVAAQKLFTIGTADSLTITFDVAVKGESSFDYMKLFLAPASEQFPASTSAPGTNDYGYNTYSTNAYNFYAHNYGGESSSYPHILNQVTGTIHVVAKMPNPNATPTSTSTALLVFAWKNDPSVGTQPPATITNLTVTTDGSSPVIINPTVTTNAATAVEQTSATLNATITNPDGVTITAKGFEWKTTGGTYTQIAGTGTGNSFTANLTGLTAGTSYTFKAFITYNGQTVYGAEQTFTTQNAGPAPCQTPTNVTTGNITHESITVTWDADDNVTSWNLQYRPLNGTLASATSTTNSYTITGLNPETTYEIQVQADCGNGNLSEWSALVSATTTVGINNYLENSVTLYPNPAKEYVDIRVDGDVNVTGMEVYDVYGKVIRTVVGANDYSPIRINVSALANGMYFVRVTTEQGTVTKRFIRN